MLKRFLLSTTAAAVALPVSVALAKLPNPNLDATTTVNGVPIAVHVANNAALAQASPLVKTVRRDGFAAAGDGGGATYNYAGATCAALGYQTYANGTTSPGADGGGCVSAVDGNAWVLDPIGFPHGIPPQVFGAQGNSDGDTGNGADDTVALQNWIDYAQLDRQAVLWLPYRNFTYYRTTGGLNVNVVGVTIRGDYCQPGYAGNWKGTGSILFFDHPGRGIQYNTGENFLQDVCTYRAQPNPSGVATTQSGSTTNQSLTVTVPSTTNVYSSDPVTGSGIPAGAIVQAVVNSTSIQIDKPATATASNVQITTSHFVPGTFDWDIVDNNADLDIKHVVLDDPTNGIALLTNGRLWIDDLKGEPLFNGVYAQASLDTDKWLNIHFWPYSASSAAVYGWTLNNLTAFHITRFDDAQLTNLSSLLSSTCFRVSSNASNGSLGPNSAGSANLLTVNNMLCDGVGNGYGILVDPSVGVDSYQSDITFNDFKTQSNNAPGDSPYSDTGVQISGSNNRVRFNNGFFSGFAACAALSVQGTGNRIELPGNPRIGGWGMQNNACSAINVAAGNTLFLSGAGPFFDAAAGGNSPTSLWGGTAYSAAQGGTIPLSTSAGLVTMQQMSSHEAVLAIFGSASSNLLSSQGTNGQFVNLGSIASSSFAGNTPSGKIGVGFANDTGVYQAYNNTGGVVTIAHNNVNNFGNFP